MSAEWQVVVAGSEQDLSLLMDLTGGSGFQFSRQLGDVVLRSDSFQHHTEASGVKSEAERILASLTGAISLKLGMMLGVRMGTIRRIGPGDQRESYAFASVAIAHVHVLPPKVTVTRKDGDVETVSPRSDVDRLIELALRDPVVEKALRLRSSPTRDWSDLYRLYEIVEHDVGSQTIIQNGWASRSEITRFARSADSVTAAGDAARHGVERQEPPPKPISLAEASRLIDRILERWLLTK